MLKLEELKSGRFAALKHDYPELHFDFLLEAAESAATWRLSARPTPGTGVSAERIADHRLLYLDYEGPVSGNRGTVVRELSGTFETVILDHNQFRIRLHPAIDTCRPLSAAPAGCFWIATLRWNHAAMEWRFEPEQPPNCAAAS